MLDRLHDIVRVGSGHRLGVVQVREHQGHPVDHHASLGVEVGIPHVGVAGVGLLAGVGVVGELPTEASHLAGRVHDNSSIHLRLRRHGS